MKLKYLALATLAVSSSTFAGAMDMVFKDGNGSVLTIDNFQPAGTAPMRVPGTYTDAVGIGGCEKGKTYNADLTVTGDPENSTVSFDSPLCGGLTLSFSGTFSMEPPSGVAPGQIPPPGSNAGLPTMDIKATLDVSSSTKSTFVAQSPM